LAKSLSFVRAEEAQPTSSLAGQIERQAQASTRHSPPRSLHQ
jgi:hypothetical protein